MIPSWRRWLLGTIALTLLAGLYHQSSQVDVDTHVHTVERFEQLRQLDARLNQYVLQSRYGLLRNYDPLVTTELQLRSLLKQLVQEDPEDFGDPQSPTGQAFVHLVELYEAKFQKIDEFKSHNAVLRNSTAYFPLAIRQLLQAPATPTSSSLQLHQLLERVLLLEREPEDTDKQHVEGLLRTLHSAMPRQAGAIDTLARHVDVILEYQSEVKSYVRDITQAATENETHRLFQAYGQMFRQREHRAGSYRLALALLSAALVAYVAWALLVLQRARSTLTESLRELNFQKYALDQHAIVSVADRSGRIVYTNDKFTEVSQYSREELLGQDHKILNSGHHPSEFFKTMWSTIGQGQVWRGIVCNRRKDGSRYWVDSTIVPFLNEAGKVQRYVSIRTDITEKKAADEQLTEQREFYENITEILGEGLYVQDGQGLCVYLNAEAEHLLGWTREDLIGRNIHEAIHHQTPDGHVLPSAACPILHAVEHGGRAYLDDQVFVRRDGSSFPVAVSCRAQLDADKKIKSVVVAFSDITKRKQTELSMRLAKETAERSNQVKSDFLANMSHEIRTPMNGIIGMTNLTLETDLNAEQREYIGLVKSSADALLVIINDILDFSKIEAGKLSVEHITFSLESMLRELMKTMALRAQDKALELVLSLPPNMPDAVQGDPGRLRQVLINLIGNAIKFTQKGEIEVQVRALPGAPEGSVRLYFAVRDTGVGIPKDRFQAIFDSFTQADTSTTRRYGGTGLGLTISAQLVALMGGCIEVDSEVGQGSTFHFTIHLPLAKDTLANRFPLHFKEQLAGQRVLVVDDNATNRHLLVEQLNNWRMQPTAMPGGQEALDEFKRAQAAGTPYALVIVDMQMPGMDGFELTQHLSDASDALPPMVMMLTSRGQRGDAERCRELGIQAYLTKPALPSDLLGAIQAVMGQTPQEDRAPGHGLVTRHSLREHRRSLKLLLVEDNPINQRLAQTQLSRQGYDVVLAMNGREAIEQWGQQRFDAVLMDVHMPEMNGYEATGHIRQLEARQQRPRTPIIAMTAHAVQGARETCLEHGMDGYISKPIDFERLWLELEGLIDTAPAGTEARPRADAPAPETLAPNPPPPEQRPIADLEKLRTLMDNNQVVFDEMRALLKLDAPARLAQLQSAQHAGDATAVQSNAHALVGMVGVFGAARAEHAARAVEHQPQGNDLPQRVEALAKAIDELLATVDAYTW